MMAKNSKDEILLAALFSFPTIREVSQATGIAESTIYARLKDPEFSERYSTAKVEMINNTVTFLQGSLGRAAKNFIDLMESEEVTPATRVNASRSVFEYCIRLTETSEIIKRIETLENSIKSGQNL